MGAAAAAAPLPPCLCVCVSVCLCVCPPGRGEGTRRGSSPPSAERCAVGAGARLRSPLPYRAAAGRRCGKGAEGSGEPQPRSPRRGRGLPASPERPLAAPAGVLREEGGKDAALAGSWATASALLVLFLNIHKD